MNILRPLFSSLLFIIIQAYCRLSHTVRGAFLFYFQASACVFYVSGVVCPCPAKPTCPCWDSTKWKWRKMAQGRRILAILTRRRVRHQIIDSPPELENRDGVSFIAAFILFTFLSILAISKHSVVRIGHTVVKRRTITIKILNTLIPLKLKMNRL